MSEETTIPDTGELLVPVAEPITPKQIGFDVMGETDVRIWLKEVGNTQPVAFEMNADGARGFALKLLVAIEKLKFAEMWGETPKTQSAIIMPDAGLVQ